MLREVLPSWLGKLIPGAAIAPTSPDGTGQEGASQISRGSAVSERLEQLSTLSQLANHGDVEVMTKDNFPALSPWQIEEARFYARTAELRRLREKIGLAQDPEVVLRLKARAQELGQKRDAALGEALQEYAGVEVDEEVLRELLLSREWVAEQVSLIQGVMAGGFPSMVKPATFPALDPEDLARVKRIATQTQKSNPGSLPAPGFSPNHGR